jgi:hypothetical protein
MNPDDSLPSRHDGDPVRRTCCCPKDTCPCCYAEMGLFGVCSPTKIIIYIVYLMSFVLLVISSVILRNTVFSSELHDVAWFVATVFVLLTLPLSAYEIGQHLLHFNDPIIQRYIVRILWMVPIFSVQSLLALLFRESKLLLETMRECYEAYVIFCLLQLLINTVARTPDQLQRIVDNKDPNDLHHMSIMKYFFKTWDHITFFSKVRQGTLQYVVVKLLCTGIELLTVSIEAPPAFSPNSTLSDLSSFSPSSSFMGNSSSHCHGGEIEQPNYYCDGCFTRFDRAYIWVALMTNFSQIWAMYCLVLFYHAFMNEVSYRCFIGKYV